jgi:hypothetical protein
MFIQESNSRNSRQSKKVKSKKQEQISTPILLKFIQTPQNRSLDVYTRNKNKKFKEKKPKKTYQPWVQMTQQRGGRCAETAEAAVCRRQIKTPECVCKGMGFS